LIRIISIQGASGLRYVNLRNGGDMASKLFHAVVGVGISLGAMSVGCSAPAADETGTSEAAQVAAPAKDPFCEVAWPTTKGGPRPEHSQACIDPKHECGTYPGQLFAHPQCVYVDATTHACDFERGSVWMFCKETSATCHEWTCPTGTVLQSSCEAPSKAHP
jgi:hypothetical protein